MSAYWYSALLPAPELTNATEVTLTGVQATGNLGYLTLGLVVTGRLGTTSLGNVTVKPSITFNVTGVSATSNLGALGSTELRLTTSLQGTASLGTVLATNGESISIEVSGFNIRMGLGGLRLWSDIPDRQLNTWRNIV